MHSKNQMETIILKFKIKKDIWQNLDTDKERFELSQLIDDILKRSDLGKWTGSASKGATLIFYCLVKDQTLARDSILRGLAGHELISYLQWS